MIIRSLTLRHGRRALARTSVRPWRRYLASQNDTQSPYDQPSQDQHFVAGGENGTKGQAVRSLENRTGVSDAAGDGVAEQYYRFQHHKNVTKNVGTEISPHYEPHTVLTNPPSPSDITLELLLASQAHLGHSTSLWNPANARYIYGIRQGIHIISLDVTASHLRRACAIVRGVTQRGGLVLFVGTRDGQERAVVKAAEMAGGCHLFDRWIPGSITNGPQILGNCDIKVVDEFDQEVRGFGEQLINRGALKPDLVVCLNPLENYVLLHECGLNNIPTIGVIDTDANPTWVTYPIPANDDSLRCIQVIAGVLGRAGQEGRAIRLDQAKKGVVTYTATHGLNAPSNEEAAASAENAEDNDLEADAAEVDPKELIAQDEEDLTLLEKYEYANLADFEEEDVGAIDEMLTPGKTEVPVDESYLRRMIALKRKQFHEHYSPEDREELRRHYQEIKDATATPPDVLQEQPSEDKKLDNNVAQTSSQPTEDLLSSTQQVEDHSSLRETAEPADAAPSVAESKLSTESVTDVKTPEVPQAETSEADNLQEAVATAEKIDHERDLKDVDAATPASSEQAAPWLGNNETQGDKDSVASQAGDINQAKVDELAAAAVKEEQDRSLNSASVQAADVEKAEDDVVNPGQNKSAQPDSDSASDQATIKDTLNTTEKVEEAKSFKTEDQKPAKPSDRS